MTHQERAEWAHESFNDPVYALLVEEDMPCGSAIVWLEQEGSPHGTMSRLCIRFPDGTKGFLPLAKESYFQDAVPDTMHFLRLDGKFVYESRFSEELTMSEGETLIHLKGTYHYEVDLVAKTVSLTVLQ